MKNYTESIDGTTVFNFDAWRAEQAEKRAKRRAELQAALETGLAVWHGGSIWSTAGLISPAGRFGMPGPSRGFDAFIEPYQSDPVYLAEHIENREYGLGFETTIIRASAAGLCPDDCGATGCVYCDPAFSEQECAE